MDRLKKGLEIDIAKNLIREVFSFLEKENFVESSCQENNDSYFIDSIEVKYLNESNHREVSINYTKSKSDDVIKYTFSSVITRIPYTSPNDFFSLSVFLESIGKNYLTTLYNELNVSQAKEILNRIASDFRQYASEIIEGKKWFDNYYPRWD